MTSDKERLLQDAGEFRELVEWLMKEANLDRETAERVVIHSGQKRIEQLFAAYIQARGQNSAQLDGLIKGILKGK